MNNKEIANGIERDIKSRWGWVVNVTVSRDGEVKWEGHRERNRDRYDMYPGMSQEQADAKVMDEILAIIQKYIPGFQYTSYEQSGKIMNEQPKMHKEASESTPILWVLFGAAFGLIVACGIFVAIALNG